jgi:protein PhnA
VLADGDTVTLLKDLGIKGSSSVIKVGAKVKSFHLIERDQDIDCKIGGFWAMPLRTKQILKA